MVKAPVMVVCVVSALMSACEKSPAPAPTATPVAITNTPEEQCDPVALVPVSTEEVKPLGEFEVTSIDGTYALRVKLMPDPPKLNELFSLWIEVRRSEGTFNDLIDLNADASMPQHGHGMSVRPIAIAASGQATGTFSVSGMLLHMPGQWKIYIDITEGAITERASFDIEVH